jgi:hypothetical protein
MACNCNEGNRYNLSFGCCVPTLAPIENYYTKSQVDKLIEDINVSGVTEEEVDEKIASAKTEIENEIPTVPSNVSAFVNDVPYLTEHQSLDGYATEQWVEDKHYITGVDLSNYATLQDIPTSNTAFTNDAGYLTQHQSLEDYATTAYVNTQISSQTADFVSGEELSSYTYDKSTIDSKIAQGGSFDPTQYYNKTEVDNKIASAKSEVEGEIPSLSGYATEQWVLDKNYISGVDLSNYATKQEIPTVPTSNTAFTNDAGYLTEHQSLSAYSTTQEVNNLINQSVSGKASQSDLETVSGDVNTLNSDAVTGIRITTVSAQKEVHIEQARLNDGYSNAGIIYTVGSGLTFDVTNKKIAVDSSVIAQKSDLSNYYNKTEVDNKVSQSTSGLQQTLSAGTNISISNNVISATDTTYSAGDGIQISGNTISTTTKFQCLTEQEWASVSGNPDTNTVYFIR